MTRFRDHRATSDEPGEERCAKWHFLFMVDSATQMQIESTDKDKDIRHDRSSQVKNKDCSSHMPGCFSQLGRIIIINDIMIITMFHKVERTCADVGRCRCA